MQPREQIIQALNRQRYQPPITHGSEFDFIELLAELDRQREASETSQITINPPEWPEEPHAI